MQEFGLAEFTTYYAVYGDPPRMPRTAGSSRPAIDARRRRVGRYVLQGHTADGIARLLGVDPETVRRDIRAILEQNAQELRGLDADAVAADLLARHRLRGQVRASLMQEYREDPWLQLAALRQEAAEDEKLLAMLQSLGLIYRQPLELQFSQRFHEVAVRLTSEEYDKLLGMSDTQLENWLVERNLWHGVRQLAASAAPERQPPTVVEGQAVA